LQRLKQCAPTHLIASSFVEAIRILFAPKHHAVN
jgi:hypothetical protein